MKFTEYESIIEAVLFASGESVSLLDISKAIDCDKETARRIVNGLKDKLYTENRGIQITEINGAYQLCSSAKYHEHIRKSIGERQNKTLSQTLLETLAIIAYMQPVTKAQIEEIRGVNADHAVNKLIEKELVCEKGRLNAPGKPLVFGTTENFLRNFGFKSLKELPEIQDL